MLGVGSFSRVARELRQDVRAARDRDPAARGVGRVEILATWPGIHALLDDFPTSGATNMAGQIARNAHLWDKEA